MPKPIITVIRPNLTEYEREKQIDAIKVAIVEFWRAKEVQDAAYKNKSVSV